MKTFIILFVIASAIAGVITVFLSQFAIPKKKNAKGVFNMKNIFNMKITKKMKIMFASAEGRSEHGRPAGGIVNIPTPTK